MQRHIIQYEKIKKALTNSIIGAAALLILSIATAVLVLVNNKENLIIILPLLAVFCIYMVLKPVRLLPIYRDYKDISSSLTENVTFICRGITLRAVSRGSLDGELLAIIFTADSGEKYSYIPAERMAYYPRALGDMQRKYLNRELTLAKYKGWYAIAEIREAPSEVQ